MKAQTGRARMPWDGDIAHTVLRDGRMVLRGSKEAAMDMLYCDICRSLGKDTPMVYEDDFYGWLCEEHYDAKVRQATVNPWTGEPL